MVQKPNPYNCVIEFCVIKKSLKLQYHTKSLVWRYSGHCKAVIEKNRKHAIELL